MKYDTQKNLFLLLDSRNSPLARCKLESPPDAPALQIRVLDDKVASVMDHEDVQLVSLESDGPVLLGRILRRRNDIIVLEKLQSLGVEIRQNLRMPARLTTFIYPITGSWRGRRKVETNDLSCGGLSFFCEEPLENEEQLEIIIPITAEPVILRCCILRQRPSGRESPLYAAQFVDLCDDEEVMVREAVFNVQLQNRPRRSVRLS